jgi:xanthosine utilization system XapX-like protein
MFFALDLAQASAGLLVGLAFALLAFPLRAR